MRPRAFSAQVFRHHSGSYPPLSGDGAKRFGGRWNAPGSFPVIYTALDEATALAELAKTATQSAIPLDKLRDRKVAVIYADLGKVLDLTDPGVRKALGLKLADLIAEAPAIPQAIGSAAHALGYEGILAPSAAGAGAILAVFADNRSTRSTISVVSDEQL